MRELPARTWVWALRSGKYKGTTHHLRTDKRWGPMGVLCDVSGLGRWRPYTGLNHTYQIGPTEWALSTPDPVLEWAGLKESIAPLPPGTWIDSEILPSVHHCALRRVSLSKIASAIEANWRNM